MTDSSLVVADNLVVSMEYILRTGEDKEISRALSDDPLRYLHGYSNIIPGLETELTGLKVGDEKDVIVLPESGYGDRDPDLVIEYPRDNFPESLELVVGESIVMKDTKKGETHTAQIVKHNDDNVILDFNHPLAGEKLYFHVKIANLREATSEELSHGHVHDSDHGN